MAWRRLELEAERSCDDAVLRQSEATAYADQLVGLAERFSAGHRSLLAMANRSDLAARVSAVLDGKQTRGRAGRLPLALACTAAAVLVLTMSPLQVVAAPQAAGTSGPSTLPVFSSVTKLVAVPVVVTYQNGTPIDGLGPKDFAVSEDGVEQTLILFEFQQADATRGSLSSQYILGYYPKNRVETTEFRKIEVTLKQYPTAQVRARQGYFARVFTGVPSPSVARTSVANSAASSDATPPVLIRKVEPEYSEAARKGKWQGTVTLDVEVSASGSVSAVTVVRSLGQGLDEKAIEAVQQWKFRPGMKGGKPVAAQTQVEVSFRLL
jgi:TonB family protein